MEAITIHSFTHPSILVIAVHCIQCDRLNGMSLCLGCDWPISWINKSMDIRFSSNKKHSLVAD
eukprot:gnl/Chilomastix_caulleri/3142.p2 GENE.gnl/Chilomastix_caulleri/3142~~gnl/Chilomastix_caulleri/3142.p2  ORF type:complete len:63 (+),score=5.97 gnl/Chilomastix_caulleri/3142:8-196(+)